MKLMIESVSQNVLMKRLKQSSLLGYPQNVLTGY